MKCPIHIMNRIVCIFVVDSVWIIERELFDFSLQPAKLQNIERYLLAPRITY